MSERVDERDCGCLYTTKEVREPDYIMSSWTFFNPCNAHLEEFRAKYPNVNIKRPGE